MLYIGFALEIYIFILPQFLLCVWTFVKYNAVVSPRWHRSIIHTPSCIVCSPQGQGSLVQSRPQTDPALTPQAAPTASFSNSVFKYAAELTARLPACRDVSVSAEVQGVFDFSCEILQQGWASQLALQCYLWHTASVIQRSALGWFHHIRGRHTRGMIGEISGYSQPATGCLTGDYSHVGSGQYFSQCDF